MASSLLSTTTNTSDHSNHSDTIEKKGQFVISTLQTGQLQKVLRSTGLHLNFMGSLDTILFFFIN